MYNNTSPYYTAKQGSTPLKSMSANQSDPKKTLSYRDAGVNIDAGNQFVEKIKSSVASTNRPGVMGGFGGFGGCFELPENYTQPVLSRAQMVLVQNLSSPST